MRCHKRGYRGMAWPQILESKGNGPKGAREEIREVRDEQDDLNNCADKLPEENDERLDKRAEEHEEMHYEGRCSNFYFSWNASIWWQRAVIKLSGILTGCFNISCFIRRKPGTLWSNIVIQFISNRSRLIAESCMNESFISWSVTVSWSRNRSINRNHTIMKCLLLKQLEFFVITLLWF